jgi:cytochrome b
VGILLWVVRLQHCHTVLATAKSTDMFALKHGSNLEVDVGRIMAKGICFRTSKGHRS